MILAGQETTTSCRGCTVTITQCEYRDGMLGCMEDVLRPQSRRDSSETTWFVRLVCQMGGEGRGQQRSKRPRGAVLWTGRLSEFPFGGACDYSFWRCTDLLRPWSVFCRFLVHRRPMHQVLLLCRPLYPPLSTETHPDLVSPDGPLIITFLRAPPHHTPLDRRPP